MRGHLSTLIDQLKFKRENRDEKKEMAIKDSLLLLRVYTPPNKSHQDGYEATVQGSMAQCKMLHVRPLPTWWCMCTHQPSFPTF